MTRASTRKTHNLGSLRPSARASSSRHRARERCHLVEGDHRGFFHVPFNVYPRNSLHVSPMRSDLRRAMSATGNPLFRDHAAFTFFVAYRGRRPVGRIVAQVHHASNARHGLSRGSFGFFDCPNDREVARRLLGTAEAWVAEQGCDEIAGNFNFTAMQQLGVVTDGFDKQPYTGQIYNPPHIPQLLSAEGYEPFFPMTTFELDLERFDPRSLLGPRQQELLSDPTLRAVPLTRRHFEGIIEDTRQVMNEGFDRNPLFVPMTREEVFFDTAPMMRVVDERLSLLMYKEDRPVGALICIPDVNPLLRMSRSRFGVRFPFALARQCRGRRAVVIFYSVVPEFQNQGLNAVMMYRVTSALQDAGYRRLGGTWIADTNTASLRQAEKVGARPMHRVYLFRKTLAPLA